VADGWTPPVPAIVLVIAATIVIIAYGWWITRLSRLQVFREEPVHPRAGDAHMEPVHQGPEMTEGSQDSGPLMTPHA
jgi:FtsZ-interacting cell division protein ZipA